MNPNKLALIISYYLARFDREGLEKLGFSSFNQAFEEIAKILGVKKNYIKLRRDEFDPIFSWRRGWQRPMDRQIVKTIEAFQDLGENEVYQIVTDILNSASYRQSEEIAEIISIYNEDKVKFGPKRKFILRAPTGKAAEEFFLIHYQENKQPKNGILIDCRDFGIGYDFRIETELGQYFVEVKGLSDLAGGILFTSKEWTVANIEGNHYFLCMVSNLDDKPKIVYIQNPAKRLSPKKNIYTSIQISWSVTQKQLAELYE
jgi:Domain of unknown function (DUF3883)